MNLYYLHDGQNEQGPFSLDDLKQQRLTRSTPIRLQYSNRWQPAERISPLKAVVAPRLLQHPKHLVPVVQERLAHLRKRKPWLLYAAFVVVALMVGLSVYKAILPSQELTTADNTIVREPLPPAAPEGQAGDHKARQAATPASSKNSGTALSALANERDDMAKATRRRWRKLITVASSGYGIGLLGGIKDLSVVVTNRTDYPIDEAVAKLTYIKASGEVWKTKLVVVKNIPANESKGEEVPDVGRGKKVKVSLQKLRSEKMNFQYIEGQTINDPSDPYVLR